MEAGASGLGWNVTIGEDCVDIHMPGHQWGWNAYQASMILPAAEFAQAQLGMPITDAMVRAYCWWWITDVEVHNPGIPRTFWTHADVEHNGMTGHSPDGKTDVFAYGDPAADDLKRRILARLESCGTEWVPA